MNTLAASALLHLTSGMRFEGPLNVDMNDITMNMVPFPRMHFLVPAMSPLVASKAPQSASVQHRAIDRLFFDVMSRSHQLMACDPRQSMYLACGLLARGGVTASDVSRNVSTLKPNMRMVYWNQEVRCSCCLRRRACGRVCRNSARSLPSPCLQLASLRLDCPARELTKLRAHSGLQGGPLQQSACWRTRLPALPVKQLLRRRHIRHHGRALRQAVQA